MTDIVSQGISYQTRGQEEIVAAGLRPASSNANSVETELTDVITTANTEVSPSANPKLGLPVQILEGHTVGTQSMDFYLK